MPVFFLSYGRTRPEGPHGGRERRGFDDKILAFYERLCEHVRQLVGSRTGTPAGFIDQSIPPGGMWEQVILEKVRTAPVFVALISADYVDSEWCGKEWDAFSRRRPSRVEGEGGGYQTAILPVIWSPVPKRRLPRVIQEVQRFAPDLPASRPYVENGLYGLLSSGGPDLHHYEAVVWQLAKIVSDFYWDFQVPDGAVLTAADLRNVFDRRRPDERFSSELRRASDG